jgi:hypothetical protein
MLERVKRTNVTNRVKANAVVLSKIKINLTEPRNPTPGDSHVADPKQSVRRRKSGLPLVRLTPGQSLLRREVHERFGGRQQGGIGPSRTAPVVLFFTDPATGHQHGYYDGMEEDGPQSSTDRLQCDQLLLSNPVGLLRRLRDATWAAGDPTRLPASTTSEFGLFGTPYYLGEGSEA